MHLALLTEKRGEIQGSGLECGSKNSSTAAPASPRSWKILRTLIGALYTYQMNKHHLPSIKGGEGPQRPHLLISIAFGDARLISIG